MNIARADTDGEIYYQLVDWNSNKIPADRADEKLRFVQRALSNRISKLYDNSDRKFYFRFEFSAGIFVPVEQSRIGHIQIETRRPARLDLIVVSDVADFPAIEAYVGNVSDFSTARQYINEANINNKHVAKGLIIHTFAFPGAKGRIRTINAWQVVKPDRNGTGNIVGFGMTDTLLLDLMVLNTKEYLARRGLVRLSLDEVMAEARSLNWQAPIRRAVERIGVLLGLGI